MLNGAEGLSELASGLVAQGLTIFDSIKKGLNDETDHLAGAPRLPRPDRPEGESNGQATG